MDFLQTDGLINFLVPRWWAEAIKWKNGTPRKWDSGSTKERSRQGVSI